MADEREHQDSAIDADDHHDGACCNACAFSARITSSPAAEPPAPPASGPLRFAIVDGRPVGAGVTLRTGRGAAVVVLPVIGLAVRLNNEAEHLAGARFHDRDAERIALEHRLHVILLFAPPAVLGPSRFVSQPRTDA